MLASPAHWLCVMWCSWWYYTVVGCFLLLSTAAFDFYWRREDYSEGCRDHSAPLSTISWAAHRGDRRRDRGSCIETSSCLVFVLPGFTRTFLIKTGSVNSGFSEQVAQSAMYFSLKNIYCTASLNSCNMEAIWHAWRCIVFVLSLSRCNCCLFCLCCLVSPCGLGTFWCMALWQKNNTIS